MELSSANINQLGAFTGAPVKKEIEWRGDKLTVYVRPMSYHVAVSELIAIRENRDTAARRIALCICDKEGNPIFTQEDVTGEANPERGPLDGALTMELLRAISEVFGLGKNQGKSSAKKKSSSTS